MSRVLCLLTAVVLCSSANVRPNIVVIIADDLGWNDVSFHGSNQILTPNIDALAYSGLILQNYYVTPICTPSRAALMTGKHPIHTGMQHKVIYGIEPRGLPLSEKLLPQYLKELGYKTHLVGKWHLGHYKKEYLPLNRGFDSHVGFWTGKIDMYDHINMDQNQWGHDFRRGFEVAYDLLGKYATDIYTDEAVKVIDAHNVTEPLFLMVAHSAVHSGNGNEPIRAPDNIIANFSYINHYPRQKFAGVLTKLDESVGKVVEALQKKNLLENSIIMFSTDNGGPANGFNENAASNYPLRGVKNTLWEGGVRGAGLLWSPLLQNKSRVATQRAHIVDWLPTLYSAAGGNASVFQGIDGVNLWEALSKDLKSERTSHINNIDPIFKIASITVDQWKIHEGTNYNGQWDKWYGPSGREGRYDAGRVRAAAAARSLRALALLPDERTMLRLRESATVVCDGEVPQVACDPLKAPCLFDVERDPCEQNNVADTEPEVLQRLLAELEKVKKTMVPPNNKPRDPSGDPKYWGRVFTNFGDYEAPHGSAICT